MLIGWNQTASGKIHYYVLRWKNKLCANDKREKKSLKNKNG